VSTSPLFTDEDLLDYCHQHCRTELGQISTSMLKRLVLLAGEEPHSDLDRKQWMYVDPERVDPLVKKARDRLRAAAAGPVVDLADGDDSG
jgi:hypothetical protein